MRTGIDNSSAHSWTRWLYPLALAVMVVVASGRSQVAAPAIINIDKIVHFSIFGLLATLVARAPGIRHVWWALAIASLFGIGDEFHQSFTPGRSVEFADWLADTSGAALAVCLYTSWTWYRRLLETPLRIPSRRRRLETRSARAAVSPSDPAPPPADGVDPLSASR